MESHNLSVKEVFTGRVEERAMDTWRSLRAGGLTVMGQVSPLVLRSRDITLPIKVDTAKAMVFPVVMYRCESRIIKKAEC